MTFTKESRRKLEFKTTMIKLKNIILSTRIEWWIKNQYNFCKRVKAKKIEIQRTMTKLENVILGRLRFKDEIENK
jgi:hypothetical protein